MSGQTTQDSGFSDAQLGAISHLYRGEVYRSAIWRTRLDTTTNWSVVTLAIALSISFASPAASPLPLVLAGILILFFLILEARRYRFFNVWRARCRWIETNFFSALLNGKPPRDGDEWRDVLADDYLRPEHHVPLVVAIGRRIRRNYLWIVLIQSVAFLGKLMVHPVPIDHPGQIIGRAAIGPVPGGIVLVIGAIYCISWAVFAFWSWRDDIKRAAHRKDHVSMG